MDDSLSQIRDYITIMEYYGLTESTQLKEEILVEETKLPEANICLLADLKDAIFKMRAFTESEQSDDLSLGIEMGMQRAADMIENIITRYEIDNG